MGSGGMPSSHAATVMGLAASICLKEGPESSLFAIAMVLAIVVIILVMCLFVLMVRKYDTLREDEMLTEFSPLREITLLTEICEDGNKNEKVF